MSIEPQFTHLHVHSEYSLLDGMGQIRPLVDRAKSLGMTSLAVTDHGVLYGAVEFYLACREVGIKPIIGCEGYLAPGDHRSKTAADRNPMHQLLLAKNLEGYRNLVQLVTKAHLDGYYYKPRFDRDLLEQHSKGLIALSSCLGGEVPQLLLQGKYDEARARAGWYKDLFGEDYYFELQHHDNLPELDQVNPELIKLARQLDIPLVATNDLHYINGGDAEAHDVLLCIGTNATVSEEKRFRFHDNSYYLKTAQEMAHLFRDYPEAILNTQRVAESVNVDIEFGGNHLPEFPRPEGMTADQYLAHMCWEGLQRRYGDTITEAHRNRLQYELDVIIKTQFANYFLVVWDFIRFALQTKVPYGVRGSAAASIVLYCLDITQIDPIETRLVFERFLNIERKEMPDIDLDFADDRRQEIIDYVVRQYGRDHVAQIITFGTLGAKAAIRDVGRALGMEYGQADRVAKLVPAALHMTLDRAMEESAELAELYRSEPQTRKLVDTAKQLEGISRHASTHAAGVVISREPLIELVPLQRPNRGDDDAVPTTQYNMDDVARIGLLKIDFLGLTNLTILGRAQLYIKETTGLELNLLDLPWDDAKTYAMLAEAQTAAVFQLESAGMRKYIKDLRPNTLGDLAAMVALYRPGPMQHIPTFIKAKHGIEPVHFPHPALAEILS
ncbi:MAG: DNA polymerase III subunit alpha, partial [Chloroflexi bacterium]|nr:DNA polymerase III subunit alpha [Chloroflexota bacterium]